MAPGLASNRHRLGASIEARLWRSSAQGATIKVGQLDAT